MTLTKRINQSKQTNPQGFISWFCGSVFEQKEIRSFLSIGRDESQLITLEDPFISRKHARIEAYPEKGGYVLKDMSSRNGTFLNGSKVYQVVLKENDRIQIGKTEFIFSSKRFQHNWKVFHQSLNPQWNQQLKRIPTMAQSDFPVLILGPSGTGKEYIAQMIHNHSKRSRSPYVGVNCSALTETLAESELFGHVKGAFTGAESSRKGAFLTAHTGTLFLDEIGDLPLGLQPKLLRAIEYQEIKPVGSDQIKKVDVRIVAATHQNLKQKIRENTFREDLYFRLNVLSIHPPALLHRMQDFNRLLDFFSVQIGTAFSPKAKQALKKYAWPGNIRELKNVVAKAKALFPHKEIKEPQVSELLNSDSFYMPDESNAMIKQIEREQLIKALLKTRGNQAKAASLLHIPRSTFIARLNSLNLDYKAYK